MGRSAQPPLSLQETLLGRPRGERSRAQRDGWDRLWAQGAGQGALGCPQARGGGGCLPALSTKSLALGGGSGTAHSPRPSPLWPRGERRSHTGAEWGSWRFGIAAWGAPALFSRELELPAPMPTSPTPPSPGGPAPMPTSSSPPSPGDRTPPAPGAGAAVVTSAGPCVERRRNHRPKPQRQRGHNARKSACLGGGGVGKPCSHQPCSCARPQICPIPMGKAQRGTGPLSTRQHRASSGVLA